MQAKSLAIVVSVFILLMIINLIRKQKMTFKYSMFWLSASVFTIILACSETFLRKVALMAGFELVSNFIFFMFLAFVIFLCLFLTVYMNEQNNRTETLAQSLGILDYRIKELERKLERKKE